MILYPRVEVEVRGADGGGFTTASPASATVVLQRNQAAEAEVQFPLVRSAALGAVAVGADLKVALGNDVLGLVPLFAGTITELSPNMPLVIKGKDGGHQALANPYKKTYDGADWAAIVTDAAARAGMTVKLSPSVLPATAPKKFRVDGQTPAQVLARACEATGWVWQVLPAANALWFGPRDEPPPGTAEKYYVFAFGALAPLGAPAAYPNVIKSSLTWKATGRYKKVVCTLVDGGWEHPAATGEFATPDFKEGDAVLKVGPFTAGLSGDAGKDRDNAKKRAYEEFLKAGAGGFEGSFDAFLNPFVIPGATIRLVDNDHPERAGYAVVAKNTFKFSPEGGGRMTVEVSSIAEGVA